MQFAYLMQFEYLIEPKIVLYGGFSFLYLSEEHF